MRTDTTRNHPANAAKTNRICKLRLRHTRQRPQIPVQRTIPNRKNTASRHVPRECTCGDGSNAFPQKTDSIINVKVEFGKGEGKEPLDNIAKRAAAYKPKERVTYKIIKEYIEAKYGFK